MEPWKLNRPEVIYQALLIACSEKGSHNYSVNKVLICLAQAKEECRAKKKMEKKKEGKNNVKNDVR